jgi:hypothetical protein
MTWFLLQSSGNSFAGGEVLTYFFLCKTRIWRNFFFLPSISSLTWVNLFTYFSLKWKAGTGTAYHEIIRNLICKNVIVWLLCLGAEVVEFEALYICKINVVNSLVNIVCAGRIPGLCAHILDSTGCTRKKVACPLPNEWHYSFIDCFYTWKWQLLGLQVLT